MRVFVAGATGATGQVFIPLAASHDLVLHVRPATAAKHALGNDPRAAVFDLADHPRLVDALRGCDAVVSFVGTMRERFGAGDTYESSDVGSTRQLVAAAKESGVPRFLLLSSAGAGGAGAYLKMKADCERIVKESGLRWTIFRPSALASPPGAVEGSHGRRRVPPGAQALGDAFSRVPGIGAWVDDVRVMPIEVLAAAFLRVLAFPLDGKILAGRDIWKLGG